MDRKNEEIISHQTKQESLKKDINGIKKKRPSYIIGFIFFIFIALYYFEEKFYNFFGNSVDFFIMAMILLGTFCLVFICKNYLTIKKKEREIKAISSKLYKLMKLETNTENE